MRDWERYVRGHLALPDLARDREARIVRELASQLEEFYHEALARGMTEAEADAHARAQITDWPGLADTLRVVDRPHARSRMDRWSERFDDHARAKQDRWPMIADLWMDLRYASRRLAAQPGFTIAALLTLGLGIGLCCLLFAFLNGLILQPLPGVREPDRLVSLQFSVAYPYFEAYRDHSRVAAAVAAFIGPVPFNITRDGDGGGEARPERVFGHIVSLEYFATIGVEPLLGRFFSASSSSASSASTVVVSERFWRTRLDADPAAIGRTLRINGGHATIIGVAAKDFLGVFPVNPADVFVPVTADPLLAPELAGDVLTNPAATPFRVLFRLVPGQTPASAREAIHAQTRQLDQQYGQRDQRDRADATRAQLLAAGGLMPWPPQLRNVPIVFFGALILLILSFTCANLAGLVLARGDARGREIAVRLSLGASRFRLVRQLWSESLLIAIGGGIAGFAAAYALLALLVRSLAGTPSFSVAMRLTPDLRVAWVTFAITAIAGMLFGLIPALAATRRDLMRTLKDTTTPSAGRFRRFGVRNLFLVYQMTAATALTVVVGFMVAGVLQSATVDLGVDPDRAWLFSLDLTRDGYTRDEARTFLLGLPDRLATVNGVDRVSFADDVPFNTPIATAAVSVEAADVADTTRAAAAANTGRESIHAVAFQRIGPGYFAALGLPLLRGAEFSADQLRANANPGAAPPATVPDSRRDQPDRRAPVVRRC